MDQRLLDAAKLGDAVELQNFLKEDPLLLEEVSVIPFAQTPLHLAVLAGKVDFVKEIIKLMPSFAKETNKKGRSPKHIACAKGYSKIVSDLLELKLDVNLCLVKDKLGRTRHYAIIKGKVDVVKMLISHYPQSLEELTAQGETVLHLAVKGNQFEAFKTLLERLKELDSFDMLFCSKDTEGNTILELAEVRNQPKPSGNDTNTTIVGEPIDDESKKKTSKGLSTIEMKNIVLIVATLLATVTYQAGLSPPPTTWKEGTKLDPRCLFKEQHDPDHHSSLLDCPSANFYTFMIINTAGFVSSLIMILYSSPVESEVRLALGLISFMLLVNYMSLLYIISPDVLSFVVMWCVGPSVFLMMLLVASIT